MVEIGKSSACVRVRGLQLTGPEEFATIKVGEDSKQKHYRALCWAARPLTGTDVQVLVFSLHTFVQKVTIDVLLTGRDFTCHPESHTFNVWSGL